MIRQINKKTNKKGENTGRYKIKRIEAAEKHEEKREMWKMRPMEVGR